MQFASLFESIVYKTIEDELMSFVENLCFENFANSCEKTVIEVIFLMEVLSSVPTPMHHSIALSINQSDTNRKLVFLYNKATGFFRESSKITWPQIQQRD